MRRLMQRVVKLGGIVVLVSSVATEAAIIRQAPSVTHVAFEAETEATIINGTPTRWETRTDSSARGSAALEANGTDFVNGAPHSFVLYEIKFARAGTYYLYYRWRADPVFTAANSFVANGSLIAKRFGSYMTPGPAGQEPFYISASNLALAPADNVYRWQKEPDSNVYIVSATEVSAGTPLIFTVATREAGMIFDRFVFSTSPILVTADLDALVNSSTTLPGPEILAATGSATLDTVTVTFNKGLGAASVKKENFALSGGLSVTSAALDSANAQKAILKTAKQTQGTVYTITVNNVTDTGGIAVAPNSQITFTAWKEAFGWVRREIYLNIPGSTIEDLQRASKFPSRPDRVEWVKGFDLGNDFLASDYGAQLTAFFHPAGTGVYEFLYANDDEAGLLLSFDDTEELLQPLGIVPPTPAFKDSAVFTFPPPLTTGQSYLLVAQLKQSSGEARLSISARRQASGEAAPSLSPLRGAQVSTFINPDLGQVTFNQQPSNATAGTGSRATFSVNVLAKEGPVYFQWRQNGVDIAGATQPIYVTPSLKSEDNGKKYSVVVSVAGRDTASSEAMLTVTPGVPTATALRIGVNSVGSGVNISWDDSAIGFTLEATDAIGPSTNWTPVVGAPNPLMASGSASVTGGTAKFYRLRK